MFLKEFLQRINIDVEWNSPKLTSNSYHVNTFESKTLETCLQELFFTKIDATLRVKITMLSNIFAL